MTEINAPATTPLLEGAPKDKPFELDQKDVDAMFEAARRGDVSTVLGLINRMGLDWYTFDIQRLDSMSKWYGPLESNGDALTSLLSAHKEGKVAVNEHMRQFLEEGRLQAAASGKPIKGEELQALNKVLNNQDLSESEAKNLYSWCLEVKPLVVPADMRADYVSNLMKTLQQKYEEELLKAGRLADSFALR